MKIFILIIFTISQTLYAQSVVQLFNVQTIKVQKVAQAKQIKSFGFIRADESRIYDVSPRFSGYIEVLYADNTYKKVKKGESLANVYSPEVLKAKDEYLNSLNYTKNKMMLKSALIKLQLLNIPKNEIQNKQKKLTTNILSPANGYIFKKNVNNKSAFKAKDILFEIVNLDKVWVEVNIHQDQFLNISKENTFLLTSPSISENITATYAGIYPYIDEKEESFTLRLEVENKKHLLKPGMYMQVQIAEKMQENLVLPRTAVIRKNGIFYVFVVGEYEGEYDPLEVQVEVLNPETYIVKSGLVLGDEVVNNALFMMDSDAQVNGLY